MDPRLSQVIERLSAGTGRVCFVLDCEHRMAWVSPDLRGFLGEVDDDFGIGRHIATMGLEPVWRDSVTPESRLRLAREIALLYRSPDDLPPDIRETVPSDVLEMFAGDEPVAAPPVRTGSIDYVAPGLPAYPIDFVATSLRDEHGTLIGTMVLMYLELRPSLISLLGRGDVAMYERMANVIHPERRDPVRRPASIRGAVADDADRRVFRADQRVDGELRRAGGLARRDRRQARRRRLDRVRAGPGCGRPVCRGRRVHLDRSTDPGVRG
jgi:hypothetical protein